MDTDRGKTRFFEELKHARRHSGGTHDGFAPLLFALRAKRAVALACASSPAAKPHRLHCLRCRMLP
jgi:hypothetical protein